MTEQTATRPAHHGMPRLAALWPRIADAETARDAARSGTLGGLMLVALLALTHLSQIGGTGGADLGFHLTQALRVVAAGLLTWRVAQGRSLAAPILLLVWLSAMALGMLTTSGMNPAWGMAFVLAILSLVTSLRGVRALRRLGAR